MVESERAGEQPPSWWIYLSSKQLYFVLLCYTHIGTRHCWTSLETTTRRKLRNHMVLINYDCKIILLYYTDLPAWYENASRDSSAPRIFECVSGIMAWDGSSLISKQWETTEISQHPPPTREGTVQTAHRIMIRLLSVGICIRIFFSSTYIVQHDNILWRVVYLLVEKTRKRVSMK